LQVKLDYPDEFLTSIHGHYGCLIEWGPVFVRSLTFESNRKTYGPFGTEQGTYFSFPMAGGKIVGFHGKSGWYLDAIGAYLKPIENQYPSKVLVQSQSYVANGTERVGYSVIQGSVGENFDIVLAVRQKDDFGNPILKKTREMSSKEYKDVETIEKVSNLLGKFLIQKLGVLQTKKNSLLYVAQDDVRFKLHFICLVLNNLY
jgi:hypothetical protein